MKYICKTLALIVATTALSSPALAQDGADVDVAAGPPAEIDLGDSVFDGDYISIGVGAAYNPSYSGSDDYVITVLPIIQGSLGGIGINPRAGGLTLDFIPDSDVGPSFDGGIAARIRGSRASNIEDEIVSQYGELDRAIEVGPSVGVSFPAVLNPFDSISAGVDVMWDVAGAHEGMVVSPSVTYFTPLSRGVIASLSLSTEWADEDFQDYYFRVDPLNFVGPQADALPAFEPEGACFTSAGATALVGVDLDGNALNGGLGLVFIAGYSRMLGDAADTPFTSIRGSRNQFLAAVGVGYTF